jgi:hypothetical protein
MEFGVKDIVAIVVAAVLLIVVSECKSQTTFIPGTAFTPGASTAPPSYTDYARVATVTPIPGPNGQTSAWSFGADYKGQRLFGQATRRVNVGDMVPVNVTLLVTLQPIR